MRVLQVATKMDRGGLETMIMNCYRRIDKDQVQFDFLLHRQEVGAYDEEIRDLGGRIHHVPRANPLSARYFKALNGFFSSHSEYRVVHSHIDCMSALPLRAARRHGVPVRIAHSHSSFQDKDFKYPLKVLCKSFIKKEATHLLACGKQAGSWMFGTEDFEVVPNAIDVEMFRFDKGSREALRSEAGIASDAFVLGHAGRFLAVKNHAFILEVFRELLEGEPGSVLVLAGDGPLRADIEAMARSWGIADSVRFLGVRSDIPALMSAMDLFVMPSLYEGLPMVLVEAQASGLPCLIADRIPSDCDLTSLVTRKELEEGSREWARAIAEMGARGGVDRAEYANEIVEAGFDVSSSADRLVSIYRSGLQLL